MWCKPTKIPGTSIGPVHTPGEEKCPKCRRSYWKVNIKYTANGKASYHCPHCGTTVKPLKPKK
jgi:Zn finger protein HypA/HybF involved in hydrogenase expression